MKQMKNIQFIAVTYDIPLFLENVIACGARMYSSCR